MTPYALADETSHLHFVSAPEYGQRVCQMGEEPWRITVCGALVSTIYVQCLSLAE